MEKKILKISSVILAVMAITAILALGQFSVANKKKAKHEQMSELQMLAYYTKQAEEEEHIAFRQQLRVELPPGMEEDEVIIKNEIGRAHV